LTGKLFADLLNFADEVAYGKTSKSNKGKEPASAFDSEDEAMDFGSDLEDDMDEDASGFETEEEMDDLEEEDDLQKFYTDEDEEADPVLKRNTEMNAARPEVESVETIQTPATTVSAPVSTGKYIPPSLRKAQQAAQPAAEESAPSVAQGDAALPKTDAQVKLERKIKGLLNKLSEANIESILADVEGLYRESSRHGESMR
jgi:nucleolar MIF4G domain-containing protein 1